MRYLFFLIISFSFIKLYAQDTLFKDNYLIITDPVLYRIDTRKEPNINLVNVYACGGLACFINDAYINQITDIRIKRPNDTYWFEGLWSTGNGKMFDIRYEVHLGYYPYDNFINMSKAAFIDTFSAHYCKMCLSDYLLFTEVDMVYKTANGQLDSTMFPINIDPMKFYLNDLLSREILYSDSVFTITDPDDYSVILTGINPIKQVVATGKLKCSIDEEYKNRIIKVSFEMIAETDTIKGEAIAPNDSLFEISYSSIIGEYISNNKYPLKKRLPKEILNDTLFKNDFSYDYYYHPFSLRKLKVNFQFKNEQGKTRRREYYIYMKPKKFYY